MAIIRGFHKDLWQAARSERAQLFRLAQEDLAPLKDAMESARWQEMLEEVARDLLRQRYPDLSATAVWDRLHAGQEPGAAG